MKKTFNIAFALLISLTSFAQNVENITIKGSEFISFYEKNEYKYPSFTLGDVYFANGDSARGNLNFNYFDQSMRFINKQGDTLAIAGESKVSLITFGKDTFFYDNGFYEWLATAAKVRLVAKYTFKLAERRAVGPYGTSLSTASIETVDKIVGSNILQDLMRNEVLVFTKQTTYFISPVKGLKNNFVAANKNNLTDLFPKKHVDDFIKQNKLNLNKEKDLLEVFIYVSNVTNQEPR
ncbi:MAG: hypothetical protein JWO92_1582 [Chitinophagaceae bacterium]|nr:hypothetical protein [Chitinophagaceae bacterium]MDB5224253.1 hypothetical protein [Chitinophagaceae bacterium]